jgi:hypothetical protein
MLSLWLVATLPVLILSLIVGWQSKLTTNALTRGMILLSLYDKVSHPSA